MKGQRNELANNQKSEIGERQNLLHDALKQCVSEDILQMGTRRHARDEGNGQTIPFGTELATNPRDEIHKTTNQLTIKKLSK